MAENGLDGEIKKVRTFKSELLEAKKAYENLVLTKAPTEDIEAAAKKVAELKDEADDANSAVGAMTGAGRIQAFTKSISAVAGGFTAIQGAIGLVSDDSKALTETFAKVQSAMALTQGLTALEDVGDSFKNLGKVGKDAFNALKGGATGFTGALKAGLAATGITLIIPILVAIAENFDVIQEKISKLIPGFGGLVDGIKNVFNTITDFLGITSEADRANEKRAEQIKKEGKDVELLAKQYRATGNEKKALALEESQINKELQLARDKFAAARTQKDRAAAAQEIKELKVTLAIKKGEIDKYEKGVTDKQKEENKKKAEDAQAARDKAAAKEKAYQDKRRELSRANALAELTDEEEIAKKRQQFAYEDRLREIKDLEVSEKKKAELRALALTENQNALDKIKKDFEAKQKTEDEKKAQDTKKFLADTEKEKLDLQQEELTKQRDELLKNQKLTDEERLAIEEAYQQQRAALNKQYDEKIVDDNLKTSLEGIDKRIAAEKSAITKGLYEGTMTIKEARQKEKEIEEQALNDRLAAAKKANKGIEEAEKALYDYKREQREKDRQENIDVLNASFDLASQLGNDLMALNEQRTQKLLADETLSAEERNAIALKQFETAKRLQYALAVIDGAKAITAILSVPDFTLGVASGIRLAAAAASTAFTLAKISQTQFEPAKAAGSKFEEGGLLVGNSHDRGGIRNYFGEMEGGEFIVNKQSSAAFLPLLERINDLGNSNSAMQNQSPAMPMQQPVIKTYVVASDVSSQQEADKRIADLAAL